MNQWWLWPSDSRTVLVIILTTTIFGTLSFGQNSKAQVDTNDINNGAVTSPKIRDGEVRNPDIADNSITSDKIRVGAVVTEDIADSSVTSEKIVDGSIMPEDLRTGASLPGETQQVSQVMFNTCSIDFDAVTAQKVATAFCPVPGVEIGDHVVVTSQDPTLDLITQSASVNASELVRIAVWNPTFKTVDPPNATWALIVFRT
jgi:hypothetical protein